MLSKPQLDDDGNVAPHDHEEILDSDHIIRRISRVHHCVPDANLQCDRLSTKAMRPNSGGMSVDHQRSIEEAGLDPREFVTNPDYIASVVFQAGAARALTLRVGYDPVPENDFHCEVWGANPKNFTSAQQDGLINACEWFVEAPGVRIVKKP